MATTAEKIVQLKVKIADLEERERALPADDRAEQIAIDGRIKAATELLTALISQQGKLIQEILLDDILLHSSVQFCSRRRTMADFTTIAGYAAHLSATTGFETSVFTEIFAAWDVLTPSTLRDVVEVVGNDLTLEMWYGDGTAKIAILALVRRQMAAEADAGAVNCIQKYVRNPSQICHPFFLQCTVLAVTTCAQWERMWRSAPIHQRGTTFKYSVSTISQSDFNFLFLHYPNNNSHCLQRRQQKQQLQQLQQVSSLRHFASFEVSSFVGTNLEF